MFNQNSAMQQSRLNGLGILATFWGLFFSVVFMADTHVFSISGALLVALFVLVLEFGGVLLTSQNRNDTYGPFIVALWATGFVFIGLFKYFSCYWTHGCR